MFCLIYWWVRTVSKYYHVEFEDFWDNTARVQIKPCLAFNFFSENCLYKISDRYNNIATSTITEWVIDSDTMLAAKLAGHTEHRGFITIKPYARWRTLFKGWL